MTSKKLLFFMLPFLISCGLEIGEPAPPVPKYELENDSEHCSNLDYKAVFKAYFFESETLAGPQIKETLNCIALNIKEMVDLVYNENLKKEDIESVLKEGYLKTNTLKPIIFDLFNSEHYNGIIFVKNNIIEFIDPEFNKHGFHSSFKCDKSENNDEIISKSEAKILELYAEDMALFLPTLEEEASYILTAFFKKHSLKKSDLQKMNNLVLLVNFLSDHFQETFPGYSYFLRSHIQKTSYRKRNILNNSTPYVPERLKLYNYKSTPIVKQEKGVKTLTDSLFLPSEEEDTQEITLLNIKYMLLNIYLTKSMFKIYDLNEDNFLNSTELKPLSCLMTPLVSIVLSEELNSSWDFVKKVFEPELISHYIINHQKIPSTTNFHFFFWRMKAQFTKLDYKLSYADVSRLTLNLLTMTQNKLKKTLEDEISN